LKLESARGGGFEITGVLFSFLRRGLGEEMCNYLVFTVSKPWVTVTAPQAAMPPAKKAPPVVAIRSAKSDGDICAPGGFVVAWTGN
jgi:hypothetical protein